VPDVALTASGDNDGSDVDEAFANKIRGFLLIIKDANLDLVVVGTIVDGEAHFLVPLGHLSSSFVRLCPLGFLA